jgi:hypothetical protein
MTIEMTAGTIFPAEPATASATPPSRAERLRDELLPDQAFEEEIAAALACSRRTVQRLNLPYVKVGTRRIYIVSGSRDVLQRPPAPEAA